MDDLNYTIDAVRPDLAALEVNPPEEYISDKIMPTYLVRQPSGKFYYHPKVSDTPAQTNRQTATAPETEQIAQSYKDFTCEEAIKRIGIAPDQVPIMGGIAHADKVGAKAAKRSVMAKREALVAALTLGTVSTTFDPGSISAQSAAARRATKGINGKLTLVGATQTLSDVFLALLREEITGKLISNLVGGTSPSVAMEGLDPEVQAKAVAVLFGCSAVLVGDDDIWAAESLEGRFAIGRFDNGDEDNHLFLPVFGRVLQYLPENEDLFKLSSHPDKTAINNLYTADTKMCAKVLNASGVYVFDGVGA